jgi:hypothetical protein
MDGRPGPQAGQTGSTWGPCVDLERFFVVEKLDLGVLVAGSTKGCHFIAHWWTNTYDEGQDLNKGEGYQITLRESEGNEDTLAAYRTWTKEEIV